MNNGQQASVDQLVATAATAANAWAGASRADRARVLDSVADALDAAADQLIPLAEKESHLPLARLQGELKRTTFQIRLLGSAVADGGYLDVRVDRPDPDWPMGAPRPDLRRTAIPLGPVVVFAASNFPFAFSVAGGDTAAALAAGCPVLVKAHGGHPELSDATAEIVTAALQQAGAPDGLFGMVHSEEDGRALLTHPDVKAGAFTGSIPAGRALFDIAQSRPEPIPFFGELGSTNPVVVTRGAAAKRADEIVEGFVGSFTMGAGQFCTKPGIFAVPAESKMVELIRAASFPDAAPMLNERIASGHERVRTQLKDIDGVDVVAEHAEAASDSTAPLLLQTTGENFINKVDEVAVECFGPTALVVTYRDDQEALAIADALEGQLTATIMGEDDDDLVPELATTLARKAGRVLWNQWPTGVSVTYAQQHGGPYPASTAAGTSSVGTAAITRFTRPVAWQGFPEHLLPEELRDHSTAATPRTVDGRLGGDPQ
ncbi:aldehyde dehydrogenase (NADP(+)) [Demetria terragena]|uniref:aldehyde dehydrogenase (NADP(+)) n=1 Tax=Demetria terragena TaxID=63959 RepID=UPI0003785E39|nr:aldehyde dehydrogenase (NADP(+)) [Demetria terragena]